MQNNGLELPTGDDNPALDWFGHLLSEDGLYPAEDVMIYYNMDEAGTVFGVAVVYKPRKYMREKGYKDHPAVSAIASTYNKKLFRASSGNCFIQDWMKYKNKKSPPPHDPDTNANLGFGPDEDFECLQAWGFKTPVEKQRAIREFARIRECKWARDMLARNTKGEFFLCR